MFRNEPRKLEIEEEFEKWLESQLGFTVHHLVDYRLKAQLKVADPVSAGKSEEQVGAYESVEAQVCPNPNLCRNI